MYSEKDHVPTIVPTTFNINQAFLSHYEHVCLTLVPEVFFLVTAGRGKKRIKKE